MHLVSLNNAKYVNHPKNILRIWNNILGVLRHFSFKLKIQ